MKKMMMFALLLGTMALVACNEKKDGNAENAAPSEQTVQQEPTKPMKTWNYSEKKDEMSGEVSKKAELMCDEVQVGDDNYKRDLMIRVEDGKKAQLMSNRAIWFSSDFFLYGSMNIDVKFDEGTIEKFKVTRKKGEVEKMVNIANSADFIKKCSEAKKIVIRMNIQEGGEMTWVFTVDEPLQVE